MQVICEDEMWSESIITQFDNFVKQLPIDFYECQKVLYSNSVQSEIKLILNRYFVLECEVDSAYAFNTMTMYIGAIETVYSRFGINFKIEILDENKFLMHFEDVKHFILFHRIASVFKEFFNKERRDDDQHIKNDVIIKNRILNLPQFPKSLLDITIESYNTFTNDLDIDYEKKTKKSIVRFKNGVFYHLFHTVKTPFFEASMKKEK